MSCRYLIDRMLCGLTEVNDVDNKIIKKIKIGILKSHISLREEKKEKKKHLIDIKWSHFSLKKQEKKKKKKKHNKITN